MAKQQPTKPKAPVERPAGRGLSIRTFGGGFRRCGRAFSAEPTVIALDDLEDEEIERLKSEPMLAVEEVDLPKAAADPAA